MMLPVSVIIPAFNEETRLGPTLSHVEKFLQARGFEYEILIVDDGSTDGTASLVIEAAKSQPRLRLISYKPNRGKGFAVKTGMLAATGDLLLQYDADGSTPIEELVKLEKSIDAGANVAI